MPWKECHVEDDRLRFLSPIAGRRHCLVTRRRHADHRAEGTPGGRRGRRAEPRIDGAGRVRSLAERDRPELTS